MAAYNRVISADFGITGLGPNGNDTLTYTVYDGSGNVLVAQTDANIIEIGSQGNYEATVAWNSDWSGIIYWVDGGTGYEATETFNADDTGAAIHTLLTSLQTSINNLPTTRNVSISDEEVQIAD